MFRFRIAIVAEWTVFTSRDFGYIFHVSGNNVGHSIIEPVCRFFSLKENVGVLSSTTQNRIFGIQRTVAKFLQRFLVNERNEIFHLNGFNFLNFV